MPDLFEIAQQVATPDYVAAEVDCIENQIASAHIGVAVSSALILLCFGIAVMSIKKYAKHEDIGDEDAELLMIPFVLSLLIGVIALIALLVNFISSLSLPEELAQWTCDPVTEVMKNLAKAI